MSTPPLLCDGDGLAMPARLRSLVMAQKPEIKITLASRKKVFTTLDTIAGTVTITAPEDTPFDNLDIEFLGTSRTYVERITTAAAAAGRSEAFHQFLKLVQPGLQEHYPVDGILKAGQAYDFAFIFVVPQQLLPRICQHKTHNPAIRDAHLSLPPTFGDREQSKACDIADDMAPEMASVRYGIFARLWKNKLHDDEMCRFSLVSKARRLRIVPALEEAPPLAVGGEESEYTMRKVKTVRKGVLKGKLGSLVMEAAQPQALRLRSSNESECRTTTMATVMLRFDPTDENAAPPKLGSLSSKLKVNTFFASTARQQLPTKQGSLLDVTQGMHSDQLSLSSRCVANVEWTKCDPAKPLTIERRDSACSTTQLTVGETPAPSETYKGRTYYSARLLVPITLPSTKTFAPTFHSCLISRVYQIKLELSTSSLGTSLDLKIPVQVSSSSENSTSDALLRRASGGESAGDDAEVEAEDLADFFHSRMIRAPAEGFVGRSRIGSQAPVGVEEMEAPPGYSAFAPSSGGGGVPAVR
ncbi:hypothetical protein LTR91_011557 [Friedmanniomyces endolithicus]|uniref:Bul1 C-terminal domain-containing protein n=1 Tax=Friedmanniomyces endolithicus TaxID=329885 RepID=A0AAN6KHJ4_9PEZI|nr:hypothetical protein LTR94_011629 [Friedmanniomyces endolithicus]KAK0791930.1 hypothetical protein LTR38_010055 [Friedmanniomyces endolithicus]KAK0806304.1 hypothetical protein LTR59_003717 [Friedmanniomyces endolithicus]KAK0817221.1 hypothetical protein LTR75_003201 [Friedmanniomyces endolithicus]KAK0842118.1 hypothetical protein LTR03_009525 [Friedmanniomyces endolithicus]